MTETVRDKTTAISISWPGRFLQCARRPLNVQCISTCNTHYSILLGHCPLDKPLQPLCSVSEIGSISSSGEKKAYFVKLIVIPVSEMTYIQKIGIVQTMQYETSETN